MFSNILVLVLFFVLLIVDRGDGFGGYHHEYLREGDACFDEATGQMGLCAPINYCLTVYGRIKYFMQNGTTCWYGSGAIVICCIQWDISWDPPEKRTTSQTMCTEHCRSVSRWVVETPPARSTPPLPFLLPSGTNREGGFSPTTCPTAARKPTFIALPAATSDAHSVYAIFGGQATRPHEFPHMAALGWPTVSGQLAFKCGGTLVSALFVLTAAHCTAASSRDSEVTSVAPTAVRLRAHELRAASSALDLSVRRIVRHPSYRAPALYNDIALVELVAPVELSRHVRPACLWQKHDLGERHRAVVTGWGITSHLGGQSNTLLSAKLTLFTNEFCQPLLQHLRNRKWRHGLSPEQMCAGDLERKHDTCRGDSGGPLQIKLQTEPDIHLVIGITSFGDSCPGGSGVAVYTRISSFIPWIESIVWPEPTTNVQNLELLKQPD